MNDELDYIAPVAVFAYNRPDKIKACIGALEKCELANKTELFVFADGYKGDKDKEKVLEVQEWLHDYVARKEYAFSNVTLVIKKQNAGLARSIIEGVTRLMDTYDQAIVVEDDLLVSPLFLRYMNEGLEYYKNNKKIWAMASYGYDLKALKKYDHDIYYGYRASSWGWASWKDRWDTVDWEVSDYQQLMKDKKAQKKFCRGGGDLLTYLTMQMNGKSDSWAIRWNYAACKQDMLTVYPRLGLVSNHGFDGSGTHSGKSGYAEVLNLSDNAYDITFEDLKLDKRITREFYLLHTDTFWKKVKRNASLKGIIKILKRL
ncbi:MAG: sugar transferase [Butyrivibrio sp.]|nr:sugar transferase [Butyrivibrio sp.]